MVNKTENICSYYFSLANELKVKLEDKFTKIGRAASERLPLFDPKLLDRISSKKIYILSFIAFTGAITFTAYKVWTCLQKRDAEPATNIAIHPMPSPLERAEYTREVPPSIFPDYSPMDFLSLFFLKNPNIPPENQKTIKEWAVFYRKLCVVDADSYNKELHNKSKLVENKKFMNNVKTGICYFYELACQTPLPNTPMFEKMRADARKILKTFASVCGKLARTPEQALNMYTHPLSASPEEWIKQGPQRELWHNYEIALLQGV